MWLRPVVSTLLLALTLSTSASSQSLDSDSQNEGSEQKLQNRFEQDVYPLLTHPEKGCVDCHNVDGTSSLVLTGNSTDDFRMLLDEQYLKPKGVDTLLTRVTTKHSDKRMPKDAEPWSVSDVQKLKSFLDSVQKNAEQNGVPADEQFPRSLQSEYKGKEPPPPRKISS